MAMRAIAFHGSMGAASAYADDWSATVTRVITTPSAAAALRYG